MSIRNVVRVITIGALLMPLAGYVKRELRVHEWGTFTSLQDEAGDTIGGINSDDEPVPQFVHDLASMLIIGNLVQGAPRCHPDVTMRLETPVIYFHPAHAPPASPIIDVDVQFRGGWLTQYYPDASADAPMVKAGSGRFGRLSEDVTGKLSWKNIRVGEVGRGPVATKESWIAQVINVSRVWKSQQAVSSAAVTTQAGESERFLFYRGVGHLDAPIRVSREEPPHSLKIRSRWPSVLKNVLPVEIKQWWLVEIREDGASAFQALPPIVLASQGQEVVATVTSEFAEGSFATENIERLRTAMHKALVEEGLFSDEARALLNTWELSYFKSPGLRLFFIVPRAWVDYYLPLKLSVSAELQRVMVGRIEMATPAHRALLQQIASLPTPIAREQAQGLYQRLGRFRNALVLDEERRRPSEGLTAFIQEFSLQAYEVPKDGS